MVTRGAYYLVHDVDAAVAFYCGHLGFRVEVHPAPALAMLSRGDLRLVLSAAGGAGDSSRHPVELFEPTLPEARLAGQ